MKTFTPGVRTHLTRVLLLSITIVAVAGCHKKVAPPPVPPAATPSPFYNLCMKASPQLNSYDGTAHTLFVRIFQLSSLDAFLTAEPEQLLDPQLRLAGAEGSVVERTLYPKSKITVEIARRPNVQYVGVVAGYYKLDGIGKSHRVLTETGVGSERCIRFGPNAIETH